jgi:hypothetical protein
MIFISTVLWLLYDFFIFKEWCNCTFASKKQKNLKKKIFIVGVLKVTDWKEQDPDPLVRGADPDPYQNVIVPNTGKKLFFTLLWIAGCFSEGLELCPLRLEVLHQGIIEMK